MAVPGRRAGVARQRRVHGRRLGRDRRPARRRRRSTPARSRTCSATTSGDERSAPARARACCATSRSPTWRAATWISTTTSSAPARPRGRRGAAPSRNRCPKRTTARRRSSSTARAARPVGGRDRAVLPARSLPAGMHRVHPCADATAQSRSSSSTTGPPTPRPTRAARARAERRRHGDPAGREPRSQRSAQPRTRRGDARTTSCRSTPTTSCCPMRSPTWSSSWRPARRTSASSTRTRCTSAIATTTSRSPAYNLHLLLLDNYCPATSLFDRRVFDAGVSYDEEIVFGHEDWDLVLQLAERGVWGAPAHGPTFKYRRRGFSRVNAVEYGPESFHEEIERRHPSLFAPAARARDQGALGACALDRADRRGRDRLVRRRGRPARQADVRRLRDHRRPAARRARDPRIGRDPVQPRPALAGSGACRCPGPLGRRRIPGSGEGVRALDLRGGGAALVLGIRRRLRRVRGRARAAARLVLPAQRPRRVAPRRRRVGEIAGAGAMGGRRTSASPGPRSRIWCSHSSCTCRCTGARCRSTADPGPAPHDRATALEVAR